MLALSAWGFLPQTKLHTRLPSWGLLREGDLNRKGERNGRHIHAQRAGKMAEASGVHSACSFRSARGRPRDVAIVVTASKVGLMTSGPLADGQNASSRRNEAL